MRSTTPPGCFPSLLPLPKGTYRVSLGFPTGLPNRPALMLAIALEPRQGFYPMGTVEIV